MKLFRLKKWLNRRNRWISVAKKAPEQKDKILVYCKRCKKAHAVFYDYEAWCLPEWCEDGHWRSPGAEIKFDYWMPLPEAPDEAF